VHRGKTTRRKTFTVKHQQLKPYFKKITNRIEATAINVTETDAFVTRSSRQKSPIERM
jgi:hypothetical protein